MFALYCLNFFESFGVGSALVDITLLLKFVSVIITMSFLQSRGEALPYTIPPVNVRVEMSVRIFFLVFATLH